MIDYWLEVDADKRIDSAPAGEDQATVDASMELALEALAIDVFGEWYELLIDGPRDRYILAVARKIRIDTEFAARIAQEIEQARSKLAGQ